jgi:hypothetical protein
VVQVTPSVLEALWKALVVASGDRKHDAAFRAAAFIRIKRLQRNPAGRILRFGVTRSTVSGRRRERAKTADAGPRLESDFA